MKKKILGIIILLFITIQLFGQRFYNIKGEPITIQDSLPIVVIVYNTNSCSACMKYLSGYFTEKKHQQEINLVVMVQGSTIITMRNQTVALENFFSKEEMPLVVYDLDTNIQQRYLSKYKITDFPCIIIFSADKEDVRFFSYRQLFSSRNSFVNKKTLKNIEKDLY